MADFRGFDIYDIFSFFLQRKRMLIIIFGASLLLSYAIIYFLMEEQYEATATIIPSEDENMSSIGGMLKGLKNLPLNIGKSSSSHSEINRYNTIIYSRTIIEDIIKEFDLCRVYKVDTGKSDYLEKTVKRLRKEILTKETDEDAFEITVRSNTPQRAADIVNFIIKILNQKIIELKVSKSRENRIFLEKRVADVYKELRISEDSLRSFQEKTGLIDVKSQLPEVLKIYGTLETDLITKQLKKGIFENLYDKNSAEVQNLEIEIKEYEKKLTSLKTNKGNDGIVIAMKALPNAAVEYYRRFRQVEINSALLEFVIPLYEQAKVDEKKDYPILQVIDYAVPPAKKTYPPRTLFAMLAAIFVSSGFLFFEFMMKQINRSSNPKIVNLRQEFFLMFPFRKRR